MYEQLKREIPNFDTIYVKEISARELIENPNSGQIRKDGTVLKMVPRMGEDIDTNQQQIPVTVKRLSNGKLEVKDGNTRTEAQKRKNGKVKISFYHDAKFGNNEDGWVDFQIKANDHETTTPSTLDDAKLHIAEGIKTGRLQRKYHLRYLGNQEEFVREIPKLLKKDYYTGTHVTVKQLRKYLEKALAGDIHQKYAPYDNVKGLTYFSRSNTLGWEAETTKPGDISNNIAVYTLKNPNKEKDAFGNAMIKSYHNPTTALCLVLWVDQLAGVNDQRLKEIRQQLYNCYKRTQTHPNLKTPLFKYVYFLPQRLTGKNAEDFHRLYTPKELGLK